MNPLFSQGNIRGMMPTFKFKCSELRRIWGERLNATLARQNSEDGATGNKGAVLMDVLDGLNRLSFDIIGLTAFDHAFDALHGIEGKMYPASWPGEEQASGAEGEEKGRSRKHRAQQKEVEPADLEPSFLATLAVRIEADLQTTKIAAAALHRQAQVTHSIQKGHGEGSRIYEAYDRMFDVCAGRTGVRGMLSVMWPGLDKIWVSDLLLRTSGV